MSKHNLRHPLRTLGLWTLPPALGLAAFAGLRCSTAACDFVLDHITTPLKRWLSGLCCAMPFAVGEVVITLGVLLVLVFWGHTVYFLLHEQEHRLRQLALRLGALLCAALWLACICTYQWGLNYYGTSFTQQAGLENRAVSVDELRTLTYSFVLRCNELSSQVPRDKDNRFSGTVSDIFDDSDHIYDGIVSEFPCLSGPERRPKPMLYSRLLSYTGFTGFFFPLTAESLVNVDQPACMIPVTILHEIAHQRNVSGEDEANFVAIVAGLHCDNVIYQYSAALEGYIYLGNALYSADYDSWKTISAQLDSSVWADLSDNTAYWKQFETPVEQVTEKVYTGFLNSYGQTDGMKKYDMCVDLLIDYYFNH